MIFKSQKSGKITGINIFETVKPKTSVKQSVYHTSNSIPIPHLTRFTIFQPQVKYKQNKNHTHHKRPIQFSLQFKFKTVLRIFRTKLCVVYYGC